MAQETEQSVERVAGAMSRLCMGLEEIREQMRNSDQPGAEALLDRILTAVREGGAVGELLNELHALLQADGDALGLYGHVGEDARSLRPVGVHQQSGPGPADTVYLCPAGRCSRYWWPEPTVRTPDCALSGLPLRRDRI